MKCIHCRGPLRKGAAPFHIDRKGCHVLFQQIPAWVCDQCGESYLEDKEIDSVQDLIRVIDAKMDALSLQA